MSMSMSRPVVAAVRAVAHETEVQQHGQQQQQQQQQQQHHHQQQQQQDTQQQSFQQQQQQQQSHQFACLYTHQKTQKRKKWRDGRFVLQSFGRGKLYDANPAPGSGNPVLAEVELPRSEIQSLTQHQETMVECEKFLIQLEGVWVEPTNRASHAPTGPSVSSSMQKLLSRKFRKPGAYRPPNPQSLQQNNALLGKRRRPLQPGELVRQHYGNTLPAPPSQAQAPVDNGSGLPGWQTPATVVPTNPHSNQPPHRQQQNQTNYNQNTQRQQNAYNSTGRQQQNGYNQNTPQQHQTGPHQSMQRSLQQQNGYGSNNNGQQQGPPLSNNMSYGRNNNGQQQGPPLSNDMSLPNQRGTGNLSWNNPSNPPAQPFSNSFAGYQTDTNPAPAPLQTPPSGISRSVAPRGPPNLSSVPGQAQASAAPSHRQPPPKKGNEFVRNNFDPNNFYGSDDDDEEDSDDDSDPFAIGGLLPSKSLPGNTNGTTAPAAPTTNTAPDKNQLDLQTQQIIPPPGESNAPIANPASTTTAPASSTTTTNNNAKLTNQDLLDLFGDGDESQTQEEGDKENHVQANGAAIAGKETTTSTTEGSGGPEFTLPPIDDSSSSESSDGED